MLYKTVKLINPKYGAIGEFSIEKKYYDMFYSMHKTRPEEALQDMLTSCYGEKEITNEMIQKVILDDYNMANSLNDVINKAKDIYANL